MVMQFGFLSARGDALVYRCPPAVECADNALTVAETEAGSMNANEHDEPGRGL
jgi:hypothetical protein